MPFLLAGCSGGGSSSSSSSSSSSGAGSSGAGSSGAGSSDVSSSGVSSEESSYTPSVSLSEALAYGSRFTHSAGNIGSFDLVFVEEGYEFPETISTEAYSDLKLGAAFSGMTLYATYLDSENGVLSIITYGDLSDGYSYGTFSGKGITTDNAEFSINIPVGEASLTCDGTYYSNKSENSMTLTMENGGFHSDIDKDDIVLGGGLEGAVISGVTPVEDTKIDISEDGSIPVTYTSVQLNFSASGGPEQYGYITVLSSGTTYNEDLSTSFDMTAIGGEILTQLYTWNIKDYVLLAFSNMTVNPAITVDDITVTGALEGTTVDELAIMTYGEYGDVLMLSVTYPASFVEAALDQTFGTDVSASFEFSANSNLEGEAFSIACSAPRPNISQEYSFDSATRKLTTVLTFDNGLFNPDLSASNFTYYQGGAALTVSEPSFAFGSNRNSLTYSCVLPEGTTTGLFQLTVDDLFLVSYASGATDTPVDHNFFQYW